MICLNNFFIKAFSPNEQLIMLQLLINADENGVSEFSDRGISKATNIPYQQVRTIHQKWLLDGTLINAGTNAGTNAKSCFVTICDYGSYNVINIFSNAVTNAVANALKEQEITKEKESVSPQTPLPVEKEKNKEKEQEEKTSNEGKKKRDSYPADFESDWNLYERKGSKKDSYAAWKELSDDEKTKMRLHIPHYIQSNERQYLKDFERYIKHRVFESPVYRQSNLLFDPQTIENNQAGLYDPSGWLNFDERFQAWRYFGREPQYDLRDGYTDDNRPDKARVVTQATVYIWSAANKNWSVTK